MLRCMVSKDDYDNNELVDTPPTIGIKLRAKQGKIIKEIELNGKKRYILEFEEETILPENFKSGLQNE